jgi:hypothetical protein
MAGQEIHLELLLGRRVRAINNTPMGRIEEIYAEPRKGECSVEEYLIGGYALLDRLSAWSVFLPLLHLLGASKSGKRYRVKWDQLDLTDVEKPRLKCSVSDLKESGENA